jgi:hypothetical protein
VLATATLNNGVAIYSTPTLAVGSYTITAVYNGDPADQGSTSSPLTQQVVQATTATGVASSLNPSGYGQAVYFTATVTGVSPTGTVQFAIDGSTFGSPVTLASGVAVSSSITTLTAGTHTVTAAYSGDTNNAGSNGTLLNGQGVGTANAGVVVALTSGPPTYGQSLTFTATINSANGLVKRRNGAKPMDVTGNVTWSDNTGCGTVPVSSTPGTGTATATCTTSTLNAGTDQITATYDGDSNHNQGSNTLSQPVSQASQTINFTTPPPASAPYGTSFPVAATATSGLTVAFTASGVCVAADNGNGTATYTMTAGLDACSVFVNQAGNANYLPATQVTVPVTATPEAGNMQLTANPTSSVYGNPVTFTATITASSGDVKRHNGRKPMNVTGTVTWSSNTGCGTTNVTNAGTSGTAMCTTSALTGGNDSIMATYSGDNNNTGGSATISYSVAPATNTVTSTVPTTPQEYGATFTATATGLGTGAITYTSDGVVCTNNGATYTMISGSGTCYVTATQAADQNYLQGSNTATVTAALANASVALTSNPNPSTYATPVTFTATISSGTEAVKGRKTTRKPAVVAGSVAWSANTGCGTTNVTPSYPGVATCTTSSATHLPVGPDTVTATYSGDANHSGSTSQPYTQQVTGGIATTIGVTSVSPSAETFGADQPVTITAVLSWTGHGKVPTAANVTISGSGEGTYGPTSCGSRSGDTVTCTATYTPTTADVAGTYNETASFSGDANYAASNNTNQQDGNNIFTINNATSTVTVTGSPSSSTYGQSVTFTATVTGQNAAVKGRAKAKDVTGTVTWSSNTGCAVSDVSGYAGVATCTTSILGAGTDTVTATYSGDANHGGNSGTASQQVSKAQATVTLGNMSQTYTGSALSPTVATVPSGLSIIPTGYPDTNAGSYQVTATVTDPNYTGSARGTFTINKAATTITVTTPPPATAYDGYSFTVVASTNSEMPVTFAPSGVCTMSGTTSTTATFTITPKSKTGATCTVTMSASGTSNYSAVSGVNAGTTTVAAVEKQTVTLTAAQNGGKITSAPYGTTFTLVATSTDANSTPTFTVPSTPSTVCTISGTTVTMSSGTGTCTVEAQWPADNVCSATTAKLNVKAEKVTPTISFTGAPSTAPEGTQFTVTATSNETGSDASIPTITAKGSCDVVATSNEPGGYQATVNMTTSKGTCTTKAAWAASSDYAAASATRTTTP